MSEEVGKKRAKEICRELEARMPDATFHRDLPLARPLPADVEAEDLDEAARFFGYANWPDARDNGGTRGGKSVQELAALLARHRAAALRSLAGRVEAPIPMVLHCPRCGLQHIDEPDERTPNWTNPPHRSHLCHGCGCIWRPADVPTEGVRGTVTVGKADNWDNSEPTLAEQIARATEAEAKVGRVMEALRPFAEFVRKYDAKPLRYDDEILAIHVGTEWEASLRLSDMRAARALIDGGAEK